jgi:hypothetical protein
MGASIKDDLSWETPVRVASQGSLHQGGPLRVASFMGGLSWEPPLRGPLNGASIKEGLSLEPRLKGASHGISH